MHCPRVGLFLMSGACTEDDSCLVMLLPTLQGDAPAISGPYTIY
jgi:hypothetical protein